MRVQKQSFVGDEVDRALQREQMYLVEQKPRRRVGMHGHNCIELSYITEGEVVHTLDGRQTLLRAGDYVIVDYGSVHAYDTPAQSDGYANIDCLFFPEILDPALAGAKSLRAVLEHYLIHFSPEAMLENPARMVFHDTDGRIRALLSRMEAELSGAEAGYGEMLRCYLAELLLLTVRKIAAEPGIGRGEISMYVSRYVAKHYAEPLTLSQIAARMGYSLPYVSQKFREESGISFMEYLQKYRVMRACRLLMSSRAPLAQIAESVGYADVKFFAGLLRRYTGLCSGDLRRGHADYTRRDEPAHAQQPRRERERNNHNQEEQTT